MGEADNNWDAVEAAHRRYQDALLAKLLDQWTEDLGA